MPTIIVLADADDGSAQTQLREQVSADLMVDPRAAGELIERIAFALVAAEQTERELRNPHRGCGCGVAHDDDRAPLNPAAAGVRRS
ncbi:MAG: hypothetical protein Q8O56_00580 [Solirubrobacteraceae bacterium]|nr:hypothetical protein [Solirubrobacteraceae bacterium]